MKPFGYEMGLVFVNGPMRIILHLERPFAAYGLPTSKE